MPRFQHTLIKQTNTWFGKVVSDLRKGANVLIRRWKHHYQRGCDAVNSRDGCLGWHCLSSLPIMHGTVAGSTTTVGACWPMRPKYQKNLKPSPSTQLAKLLVATVTTCFVSCLLPILFLRFISAILWMLRLPSTGKTSDVYQLQPVTDGMFCESQSNQTDILEFRLKQVLGSLRHPNCSVVIWYIFMVFWGLFLGPDSRQI